MSPGDRPCCIVWDRLKPSESGVWSHPWSHRRRTVNADDPVIREYAWASGSLDVIRGLGYTKLRLLLVLGDGHRGRAPDRAARADGTTA